MNDQITFALKLRIYGLPVRTPFDVITRLARQAEDVGFDGVYVIDHLFLPTRLHPGTTKADSVKPYFLEAWTTLAALAQVTRRVKIGPQISPLTFRHPALLAKMGATVDLISNGRLVMQLGTGWNKDEHEMYGLPYEERFGPRFERLIEGIEIIQGLWRSEEPFSYEGKHFQIKNAPFWPKPVQRPLPPLWLGGMGKKVRAAVAKYADGWSPAMPHIEGNGFAEYSNALREIRELAESYGRDPNSITPGIVYTTVIHEDRAEAARQASLQLRRPDYAGFTVEQLRDRGILMWGNVDDCLHSLEGYIEAGVRYFTLTFVPFGDVDSAMRGMELYGTKIIPRLG